MELFKRKGIHASINQQFQFFGQLVWLLSQASKAEFDGDNELSDMIYKRVAEIGYSLDCDAFNDVLYKYNMDRNLRKIYMRSESYVQELFCKYIDMIIPGCQLMEQKRTNEHNIPDEWVCVNKCEIPVEIKKDEFGSKALEQLMRYMSAFNCEKGIAVGRKLSVPLPNGVIFVSVDDLEFCKEMEQENERIELELASRKNLK